MAAKRLVAATEVFTLAESLGGVESLIELPGEMTHASVAGTDAEVPADLVRLSVGVEHLTTRWPTWPRRSTGREWRGPGGSRSGAVPSRSPSGGHPGRRRRPGRPGRGREGRWIATEAPVDIEGRRQRMAEEVEGTDAIILVAEAGGSRWASSASTWPATASPTWAWRSPPAGGPRGRHRPAGRGRRPAGKAGAHKLALQVWPHNTAAIALYERFGFQREGYLRRHYRRRTGELWDAIIMGLPLDRPRG